MLFRSTLDTLLVEIQRSADYYSSQLRQGPIQEVTVALQLRENDRVAEAIEQQLSLKVSDLSLPDDFRQLSDGDGSDLANLGALNSPQQRLDVL